MMTNETIPIIEEPIITCSGLTKCYGSIVALDDITLSIPKGRLVGLLGPNGSGKTTFIKLLSGLLTPTKGSITVDGKSVGTETKSVVSYLPERIYFDVSMRVEETLNVFSDFYGDFDRNRALFMLSKLGIDPSRKIKTLSKGTREKVQLILVMSRRAKLFLLDEPIAGVDPASRDYIINTILHNIPEDSTVIISTHLLQDIEPFLNEFIFVSEGHIILQDSVQASYEKTGKTIDQLFREMFRC